MLSEYKSISHCYSREVNLLFYSFKARCEVVCTLQGHGKLLMRKWPFFDFIPNEVSYQGEKSNLCDS